MMKKCLALAMSLAMGLTLSVSALAVGTEDVPYIADVFGILSEEEWTALEQRAEEISDTYDCGVYAVVLDDYQDYGADLEDACYNIHRDNKLDRESIILLLSMGDRDYCLKSFGPATDVAMTDYSHETLQEAFLDNFGEDDWYGGFSDYLEQSEVVLAAAEAGTPLDYPPLTTGEKILFSYVPALVVGLLAALITCSIFKAQMKTALRATSAEEYLGASGVDMRIREDRYTHTTRTQRKIEKKTQSSGGNKASTGKF